MSRNTFTHFVFLLSFGVLGSYWGDSILVEDEKGGGPLYFGLTAVVDASLTSGTPFLMSAFDVRKKSDDFLKIETSLLRTRMGGVFCVHFIL